MNIFSLTSSVFYCLSLKYECTECTNMFHIFCIAWLFL